MSFRRQRAALALLTLSLGVGAIAWASFGHPSGFTRTEDRNRDGRPDVWRKYDAQGELVAAAIDTNFDGRSDVHEVYVAGALVRRELDLNFDDRVDVVEEFDPDSHEHIRSVVDVDEDGTADLLVLFQGGRPVFSRWADNGPHRGIQAVCCASVSERRDEDPLASFVDPFRTDLAVRGVSVRSAPDASAGLFTTGGLPRAAFAADCPLARAARRDPASVPVHSLIGLLSSSPRGPPLLS